MTQQQQPINDLLDRTFSALGGDVSATTPDEGADLIQEWIEVVRSNVSTQWLTEPLEKLQTAVQAHKRHEVDELLHNLSGITIDFANNDAQGHNKEDLQNLSTVLKGFAQNLANAQMH
ncbi:hypothetical protein [Spirosoma koreense]